MKIAGITAEYNPLHKGHVYHINETRRLSGCDAVVVAMSGDFVQRGEPAILNKWLRAEHALKAGADLVVEIPALFCLGNAAQYASASVGILEALGCGIISFGSESGDVSTLAEVSGILSCERETIDAYISSKIKEGKSYPAARSEAYKAIRSGAVSNEALEKELAVLGDPNDILALEYIRSMKSASPLVIKREGDYHKTGGDSRAAYASAESIRASIKTEGAQCDDLAGNVPDHVVKTFSSNVPVFPGNCFDLLKYAIISTDADIIDECPSGGEGLGNLLKNAVKESDSYNDLILRVKSKRYTYTRISRLCMQLLLGISREQYDFGSPGYIRVLGLGEKGREILALYRKASKDADEDAGTIPCITNINKEANKLDAAASDQLALDIHASEIYALIAGYNDRSYVEQRMRPVIV